MLIRFKVIITLLLAAIVLCPQLSGAEEIPVTNLRVTLLPENTIRVSWDAREGATEYRVERWEIKGTGHWHFDVNEKTKPSDTSIILGGVKLDPRVYRHKAGSESTVEFNDLDVKPGHTYFYRVNGGIISVRETRSGPAAARPARDGEESGAVNPVPASPWVDRQKNYEKTTDYPERMAADLVMSLPNWLIAVIGLRDPLELVFGIDLKDSYEIGGEAPEKNESLVWNTFDSDEFRVVDDFYRNAKGFVPVFMTVGIVIAGILVLVSSTSPKSTLNARGYITGILICALLIKTGPYLVGFLFDVNRAIVSLCHSAVADEIHRSFLHTVYNKETRSLGAAFLALLGCISIGVINFQFAMRKIFIAVLIGILPLALINAIFPGRRNALAAWVREFTSYAFMPAGLAVGISFFIHFINSGEFWVTLVCLIFLPAINSLVRGVLGLSDSGLLAGAGSAVGMGALFSLGGIIGGSREVGSSVLQAMAGGVAPGGNGSSSGFGKKEASYGSPDLSLPGTALGKGSPGIVKSIAGSSLKGAVSLGVAGSAAMAGSVITGALTGDPVTGLELGAGAGKSAASTLQNSGSSLKNFFSEIREKGFEGATGIVDRTMLMDPGVTSSLALKALGDNAIGSTVAAAAASTSGAARALSSLVDPGSRERLDYVSGMAASMQERIPGKKSGSEQAEELSREYEKIRQAQNYRNMFEKIRISQYTGGFGGIEGSEWR